MAAAVVLGFNIQKDQIGKLRMLCARIKARFRVVEEEDFGQTMLSLVTGQTDSEKPKTEGFTEPMLLMAGMSSGQFNLFLKDFKHYGIAPIALKAVMTPTNANWTPVQLHGELSAERDAFARGEQSVHSQE